MARPTKDDWLDCLAHLTSAEEAMIKFPYSKSGPHDTFRQSETIKHLLIDVRETKRLINEYLRATYPGT